MQTEPVPLMWREPNAPPNTPPLVVFFKEQAQRNEAASKEAGYDCFDNVLIAEIQAGAQAKSSTCIEIERKLPDGTMKRNEWNYRKYKLVVDDFKTGSAGAGVGTPLHFLPGMDVGRAAALKSQGIHWIESVATMPQSSAGEIMGFHTLKAEAVKFLELREKNAPLVQMKEVETELRADNARLQRQLDDLVARLGDGQPETQRKKPGPKPRVQEQEAA